MVDNVTEDILIANYFETSIEEVLDDLFENKVYPIVYAYIDGKEKFSFVPELCTKGMRTFLASRKGDIRTNAVNVVNDLKSGDLFYITCIDKQYKLKPLYEKYKNVFHCVYHTEMYTNEQWLEIMPKAASKSNAILQLKDWLKCDRLVVFGDGKNDIDMFQVADECYAVENAVDELKQIATDIISSNEDDGVAKWLERNVK